MGVSLALGAGAPVAIETVGTGLPARVQERGQTIIVRTSVWRSGWSSWAMSATRHFVDDFAG
jgi:hypothetical protein